MFGSHFQTSAYVAGNQLARVFGCAAVRFGIFTLMKQQVVTHAASDERLLDSRQSVYRLVDIEQRTVVGIQVRTNLRMYARRTLALPAYGFVASFHAVHVGRRTSQIAQVTFEVGQLCHFPHLFQDRLFAAAHNKLALMGGDGTESAPAEASAMDVDGELDHVVCRNPFAFVFGMGQTRIRQVERTVELFLAHGRVGRIHHDDAVAHRLRDARRAVFVRLLFDVPEVGRLFLLVRQTFFVRIEPDIARFVRKLFFICHVGYLRNAVQRRAMYAERRLRHTVGRPFLVFFQLPSQLDDGLFSHSVNQQVGAAVAKDAFSQRVLPIVVMAQSAHARLYASQYHRNVGVELFQYLRVNDGRIFRAHIGPPVGRISVFAAETLVGGVFVYHRVHTSGGNTEEQTGASQLLKVAQVIPPVGLGNNGNLQSFRFEDTSDYRRPERRMVYIRVAAEENHIQFVPSAKFHF